MAEVRVRMAWRCFARSLCWWMDVEIALAAFISDVYALPCSSICVTSICCSGPLYTLEQEVAKPIFRPQGAGLAHPGRRVAASEGRGQSSRKDQPTPTATPTPSAHAVNRPYIISGILSHSLNSSASWSPSYRLVLIVIKLLSARRLQTRLGTAILTDPTDGSRPDQRAELQSIAIPWHQVWKRHTSRPSSPTAQHR